MCNFLKKINNFDKYLVKNVSNIAFYNDFYVPQGICYAKGYYFLTMYDYKKISNSLLYIFKDNKLIKKIFLDNKAHCGGISYDEKTDNIYITGIGDKSFSYIYKYSFSNIISKLDGEIIKVEGKYEVDNNNSLYSSSAKHSSPAYLNCYNGYLYVGNFCNCKDLDKAIIKKYKILTDGSLSSTVNIIKCPFSYVQGICVFEYNGEMLYVFSRSFGRKRNSLIHICNFANDKFNIISTKVLPSMLEQVSFFEKNLIVVFESASNVYKDSAITVNDGIYLISLESVLNSTDKFRDFCRGTSFFISNRKYWF